MSDEYSAIEQRMKPLRIGEAARVVRDWIELERKRLNQSLANPKHDEVQTALLRGEYRQLNKLQMLLEDTHDPI